jgi:hypothetical protein
LPSKRSTTIPGFAKILHRDWPVESYPDQDLFIDNCCHLTARGNDVVAELIFEILRK